MFAIRFVALAALTALCGWSQITTGTIAGVVEDASGAVVPNAEITAKQIDTGETRQVRSTASGEFTVPFLHIGAYSVTVAAGGFKTKSLTGLKLEVDQTLNLKISLEVGAASERVEVTGVAPLVDSATSSLGQVIENKQITDL